MSTKYKVQFEGETYTRATQNRTYTHLVLVRYNGAKELEDALGRVNRDYAWQRAEYELWAREGWEPAPWMHQDTKNSEGVVVIVGAQRVAEFIESGRKAGRDWLARYPTVQHRLDEECADRAKNGTDRDYVREHGWCGRRDLADKLANRIGRNYAHPIILDAVTGEVVRP